jgi:hypothetical protein
MALEMEELLVDTVEKLRSRFYGKYRGLVVDADDPEKFGRIRAQVPEVLGDQTSPWALPAVPFAGPDHGFIFLPEENDGVWIEFEAGDPSRPIWTGCWWGQSELPDPGAPKVRAIVTKLGHQFVLDDDAEEILLHHASGPEMKMTGGEIKLSIGQAELSMTGSDITLKVGLAEIKMTMADLTLKGGPSAQIKLSPAGVIVNNGAIVVL